MLHRTVHAPDPINRSSASATDTRNSGTQPVVIPHQPIALGATSEVHWFYGLLINTYYSRLSWNERYHSLENSTHAVSNK